MSKTRTNYSIDYEVWLYWKEQNVNVSEMVNDFLKGSMLLKAGNYKRAEVELEIEEIKDKLRKNNSELTNAHLKLAQIHKEEEENQKVQLKMTEEGKQWVDSIKANNPLRYM